MAVMDALLAKKDKESIAPPSYPISLSPIGVLGAVVCVGAGALATAAMQTRRSSSPARWLESYLLFAIRVADQWEKVAVLRLGDSAGCAGPGLFHIIPVVDTMRRLWISGYG